MLTIISLLALESVGQSNNYSMPGHIVRSRCHSDETVILIPEQWPDIPAAYNVSEPSTAGRFITVSPAWRGQARSYFVPELNLEIQLPERPDPCR